ncbi:methyltransferase [Aureimonas sp. SA4125]|nr:methyltransferase [Aureimonas sp. SA4125]
MSPSSRRLGRAMAASVPVGPGMADMAVLEIGPGTGAVTQCLIDRGVPEESLVLAEYSPEFCELLASRFPKARIVRGDAYAPNGDVEKALAGRSVAAVVSGLPLFTKPDSVREAVISGSLDRMAPGSPFIQFSYALTLPVKPDRIGASVEIGSWVKLNLPPARVLVYRRG